ncbi:TetR/AcrR family transcriptional regulator [Pseudalkalibacillus hwajinpoensis]|uniref:TetR/AcrR family transcriptional regulator n=1 Tax=Guptibacillus hwajinpoensis TaxID=208199 RepID=A0A4U1MN20_9BACL|nr:TetR/AcrR family transcriptional regulator [Pseudalkalibacillus hwajinpoensis]TKD72151.1 TetR/AcrR family transcriptional regulator [Pseudalkalibacillus hwajinpoensis]
MNDRKQHVIQMAHQLFIERGFQATSIQDILEYSGISKGTFYNYFSSKNELLIALFKALYETMETSRNELLIGQDPSDLEIFVKQIEFQMNTNKKNKLITLFEEVFVSTDEELKDFLKVGQMRMLRWVFNRFIELFGEEKRPYLLDSSIMFLGMLHHNVKYYSIANGASADIYPVVRYTVNRIVNVVDGAAESGDQLNMPEQMNSWLPDAMRSEQDFQDTLYQTISELKENLVSKENHPKSVQLLDFVQDELLHSKKPRKFLIESVLLSIKEEEKLDQKLVNTLNSSVESYFERVAEACEDNKD